MSRNSSQFNRQNELIRSLRKQLEATERELASQKWVFEQFLKSPSWRMTYPIRWLAKQFRAFRDWLMGIFRTVGAVYDRPSAHRAPLQPEQMEPEAEQADQSPDLKAFFTELYRVQLRSFLASNAWLELPHSEKPDISVLLVLFNRAELTLACLRSLAENHSEGIEIIIVDNASSDDTPRLLDRLRGARVIRNSENRNFLLSVNQATREASGEYLLILNNDTELLPGTLRSALATMRSGASKPSVSINFDSMKSCGLDFERRLTATNRDPVPRQKTECL